MPRYNVTVSFSVLIETDLDADLLEIYLSGRLYNPIEDTSRMTVIEQGNTSTSIIPIKL